MNSPKRKWFISFSVLVFVAIACSFTAARPPQVLPTSTPDMTMTAVVAILQGTLPTSAAVPTDLPPATQAVEPQAEIPTETPIPPTETPLPPTETPIPPTLTPIPTNTNTIPPTASYAGPGMRTGASVAAVYQSNALSIDGDLSEWSAAIYPAAYPVYGANKISAEADLWANVMVTWDVNYLYVGARIKDDQYHQNASGITLFKGDSVEIVLDTDVGGDYYLNVLSSDDYQLGVSPGNPGKGNNPEAYLWYPENVAGPRTNVSIGVMGTANGYHIELAIPWSLFGIHPYAGQHFGFAFSVSDNDTGSENVQQSMISNVPTRYLAQPMTWGDLTLTQ
mgnify:CR=1 FL=1